MVKEAMMLGVGVDWAGSFHDVALGRPGLESYLELRKVLPHGETGAELRAIARDDERAARDERRIGNRLRADLLAVFPAATGIAAGDLAAPVFLRLLERWPSAGALAA